MKQFKYVFLMLALVMGMASCSDNDNEDEVAKNVVGNYAGYAVAKSSYFSNMVSADQSVSVTLNGVDKVDLSYVSSTWGTITIEGATVSESAGVYKIVGTGKSVMSTHGSGSKEYECNVSGSVAAGVAEFTFTCPTVMNGLTIEFKQGEVPASIVLPGTYSGYTEASSNHFTGRMTDGETLTISAVSGSESYAVSYTSETWGEFTIGEVTAELKDGVFTLTGSGVANIGMNGNVKDYACTFSGTVDAEKSSPEFLFTVPGVMGTLNIKFKTGTMPTE